MAYLKYRGLTTTPTKPNAITAAGVPLTNAEIDGNLASLNDMKLENSGYVPGNIVYADTNGTLVPLAVPTTDGAVLTFSGSTPSWATTTAITSVGMLDSLSVNGYVNATNFNSTSDARFKSDIEKIENALTKIKQLTGYHFTMNETGERSSGLLAQDVKKVQPESVGGTEEKLALNYDSLLGLVVEAIKEIDDKLTSIQNQISNK